MKLRDKVIKSELIAWKEMAFLQDKTFKKLPKTAKQKLKESIKNNDFVQSFKVWQEPKSGIIYCLDGFHRVLIMKELEQEGVEIPEKLRADFLECETREEAAKLVLIYSSSYAKITEQGMDEFIRTYELQLLDFRNEVNIIDFNMSKFEKNMDLRDIKDDNFDASKIPVEIHSQKGDVYDLNHHRLICGDAKEKDAWKMLMTGMKARMIFTDPPYGVKYTGVKNSGSKWKEGIINDNLKKDGLFLFLREVFVRAAENTIENPAAYVFYASRNHIEFESALIDAGFNVKQQLIWAKSFSLSRADYHWSHEPILYAIKNDRNCEWYGDRSEKTVNKLNTNEMRHMGKEDLIKILNNLRRGASIWEIKKDNTLSYNHPTQKPIALSARAMLNSSTTKDIVVDPFSGSGSTLMGAEMLDRQARVMDLDPKFVDLNIKRWVTYMNKMENAYIILKNGKKMTEEEINKIMLTPTKPINDKEQEVLAQNLIL